MATTSALREFMPYGAPELIEGATRRTFRATLFGMGIWLIGYVAILTWMVTHPAVITHERTAGSGEGVIVVQSPEPEVLPKLNEFVYVDELPVLVTDTPPVYPEVAREAVVEGEVLLRVLVGKDGRVADVHVDRSIPMLDQAAVDAAKTWVFKPALSQNRPVAVWITRRVRFSLQQR